MRVDASETAAVGEALDAIVGPGHASRDAALAPLTTFRVGGTADWLVETDGSAETMRVVAASQALGLPVTILGGGSNVLVSDAGVRGIVIRMRQGEIVAIDPQQVRADAGITINGLVRWTINRGLAGLEAWAGTPGTVGGAVYGNAHFKGRLVSELVTEVRLLTRSGETADVTTAEMEFGYDYSRLHRTGEIVLSAVFGVGAGEPGQLRETARASLAFRKKTQPLDTPSAGCIFQNPDPARDRVPEGIPYSAGALIDRTGLKGRRIGGARISATHGNFIVNEGGATAADIRALIALCRRSVAEAFGVDLREEIVYLGDFAHVEPVD